MFKEGEEEEELLPRPVFTNDSSDNETQLRIIQEGRNKLQAQIWHYKNYHETAQPLLR